MNNHNRDYSLISSFTQQLDVYEPRNEKTCFMLYAKKEDADQPVHVQSDQRFCC